LYCNANEAEKNKMSTEKRKIRTRPDRQGSCVIQGLVRDMEDKVGNKIEIKDFSEEAEKGRRRGSEESRKEDSLPPSSYR
jgi:hypothetical protein